MDDEPDPKESSKVIMKNCKWYKKSFIALIDFPTFVDYGNTLHV